MDALTKIIMLRLLLAAVLGMVVGFERWYKGKAAGIRTYALVSLGSALFTMLSVHGFGEGFNTDPARVAAQIVVGVGFIGAGLIFLRGGSTFGLTTAAGIWAAAAMGMAVGLGFYLVATYFAFLTIVILSVIRVFERWMPRASRDDQRAENDDD